MSKKGQEINRNEFIKAGLASLSALALGLITGCRSKNVPRIGQDTQDYIPGAPTPLSPTPLSKEALLSEINPASTFGVSEYSKNPDNWTTTRVNEPTIGYGLTPESNGLHVRVQTAGSASDSFLDLKDAGEIPFFQDGRRAMALVTQGKNVPLLDIRGGTFWQTNDPEFVKGNKLVRNLFSQVIAREVNEQPGTLVIPVGFAPECFLTNNEMKTGFNLSVAEAASKFGNDSYTQNPSNWEVTYNEDNVMGLHLIPDPEGYHHRLKELKGTFYEGYVDVKDDNEVPFTKNLGQRPIAFVGNGDVVPNVDLRGGTIWTPRQSIDGNQLNKYAVELFKKLTENEITAQPGILVLPFGFNPNSIQCQ